MALRKVSEIWSAIDSQKPENVSSVVWKQSYDGTKAALLHVGLVMLTTREEFDAIPIPIQKNGQKKFGNRNIHVRRDQIVSTPTRIENLLSGNSSVQTDDERNKSLYISSQNASNKLPQGNPTSTNLENKTQLDLILLLQLHDYLDCINLWEHRKADVAYCMKNHKSEGYVAEQIKSAQVDDKGCLTFSHNSSPIKVKTMIEMLEAEMSLTFVAKNVQEQPDVVWLFHGADALNMLRSFPETQPFRQRLHLKIPSTNPFTLKINEARFRFDIGSSADEITRLRDRKIEITQIGVKKPLEFWNEDDTQIRSFSHRIEHMSFDMIREACSGIGSTINHFTEDYYTSVDFRLNSRCRIQDKVGTDKFHLRSPGRYAYDPDEFDILQISIIKDKEVYAIPMRTLKNDLVVSTLSADELMKCSIWLSVEWKKRFALYRFNLNKEADVRKYVETCESAHSIPRLTNRDFYIKLLKDNQALFGAKNKYKKVSNKPDKK